MIIPVFNAESTLRKCVESLVYGELRNIKIILIDDCSEDESWTVCQTLSRQYRNVVSIKNNKNRGVSFSRNRGFSEIEGEFVLFVDSDDWVSGKYARILYNEALENPDELTICGFRLIDYIGNRKAFIWSPDQVDTEKFVVSKSDLFRLKEKTLLQQLWNKIFRRDIIEKNHICFDEKQSMGEDFQFVLDYIKVAHIEKCTVINKPLYYYIRANNTSLMSKFGLTENENAYDRIKQLLQLAGEDDINSIRRCEIEIENSKMNAVYQAVHFDQWSKEEKLAFIRNLVGDEKALSCYRKQNFIKNKETISATWREVKGLYPRLIAKLQREKSRMLITKMKSQLRGKNFSIISQNCIGGVFYHDMGLQFTSPTINLYFRCNDFVKLALNLRDYLNQDLRMTWGEEYPIGYLDDVTVFFQHYGSCSEAKEKWEERKKRINYGKIIVLCTDMEGFTDDIYEQWKKIPYPKLLFSAKDRSAPDVVFYPEYSKNGKVADLIPDRKFYKKGIIVSKLNELQNGENVDNV